MIKVLTTFSLIIGCLVYIPSWIRILKRRSTGDFSRLAQCLGMIGLFTNLAIALLTKTVPWIIVSAFFCCCGSFSTFLVFRFHDVNSGTVIK